MKKKRARPIYAYAIKTVGGLELDSLNFDRDQLIMGLNRPAGESVVPVRITEIDKAPSVPSTTGGGEA